MKWKHPNILKLNCSSSRFFGCCLLCILLYCLLRLPLILNRNQLSPHCTLDVMSTQSFRCIAYLRNIYKMWKLKSTLSKKERNNQNKPLLWVSNAILYMSAIVMQPQFKVSFARVNYTIERGTTQMPSSLCDNENSQKEHKFHSDVKTTTENRNICKKTQHNSTCIHFFPQTNSKQWCAL